MNAPAAVRIDPAAREIGASRERRSIGFLRAHAGDIALLAMAGLAAAALITAHWRIGRLEAALQARPPVAVADYGRISEALALGAAPEIMRAAFESVKAEAARLAAEGYLVINRATLEAAPDLATFGPDAASARALAEGIALALRGAVAAPPRVALPEPAAPAPAGMTEAEAQAILRGMLAGSAP